MMTLNDRAHDGKINGSFFIEQENGRYILTGSQKTEKKCGALEVWKLTPGRIHPKEPPL